MYLFFIKFNFMLYYLLALNVIFYKINKKIHILILINSQYIFLLFKKFQNIKFLIHNLKN